MAPEGRSGIDGVDFAALGIPTMEEVIARYSAKTGFDDMSNINWYLAYNLFRIAAILQGIRKRVEEGTANSPQAAEMSKRVLPLVEGAWAQAQKAGANL
jgi:aminoglycoside phosphotransferase (APT) family kinase protein